MPPCVLLTAKDRLGRKQLASAGALNRTSKGKKAAVCGACNANASWNPFSEEAAHQIGAILRTHQVVSHSGAFLAVGFVSLSCAVPTRITSPSLSLSLDKVSSVTVSEGEKQREKVKERECGTYM